jgi:hypothetical protein
MTLLKKITLPAIVAVLAFALTAASKSSTIKKSIASPATLGCNVAANVTIATDLTLCSNARWTAGVTNCPGEILPPAQSNFCVKTVHQTSAANIACPGTAKFCCAELIVDQACAATCGAAIKIRNIYCKN